MFVFAYGPPPPRSWTVPLELQLAQEWERDDPAVNLSQITSLCLPSYAPRSRNPTLRPERPQHHLGHAYDGPACREWVDTTLRTPSMQRWKKALNHLLGGIGGSLADFRTDWSMLAPDFPADEMACFRPLFSATAAILCDLHARPDKHAARAQVTNAPPAPISDTRPDIVARRNRMLSALLEHMLLVDYGIGAHPLHEPWHVSARRSRAAWRPALYAAARALSEHAVLCRTHSGPCFTAWRAANEMVTFSRLGRCGDVGDVALMLHWFHVHRRAITAAEFDGGLTGYTGVLAEMVAEIPRVGTDRLLRKLSVDVHEMIPRHVRDSGRRARMVDVAYALGRRHGIIHLLNPDEAPVPRGPPAYPAPPRYADHWADAPVCVGEDGVLEGAQGVRSDPRDPRQAQARTWVRRRP